MKFMVTWHERPQGSAIEYENAQKRILEVFRHWQFPESVTVHQFLVRLGTWGGFVLLETDEPLVIHKLTTIFPAFAFRVDPVLEITDAVGAELEGIAWRDSLK